MTDGASTVPAADVLRVADAIIQRLTVAAYALDRNDRAATAEALGDGIAAARELVAGVLPSGAPLLPSLAADAPDAVVATAATTARTAPDATPERAGPGRRLRAVLADDTADVRLALRMMIEARSDIEVVGEAADGQEALDLVAELEPDVLLLDLSMPVLDGIGVLRSLQQSQAMVPVIVLSGYGRDHVAATVLDLGAVAYLEKGGATRGLLTLITDLFPDRVGPSLRRSRPEVAPAA
jgi:CheY-like chemotaxis protein